MKRTISFLLLAMVVFTPAQTNKNGSVQTSDATRQALIDLENSLVAALMKSDAMTLDSMLTPIWTPTSKAIEATNKECFQF